jgi:hypothetical membrane protein
MTSSANTAANWAQVPNAIIMNTNFVVTGLLIIALATGLYKNINGGRWTQIGSILLLVFGAGEVAGGFFPCDPGCPVATHSLFLN